MDKILLIVNTGTPDNPGKQAVRKYLREFLGDPRVIDMPFLIRKILVNLIIVPFRASKSARLYKKLWTGEDFPLRIYMEKLTEKLSKKAGAEYTVVGAMRYGKPSLRSKLKELRENAVKEITVLPLFPQYASSTTGSIKELVTNEINSWDKKPVVNFVDQFYSENSFIEVFASKIKKYNPEKYDHILFSYHGLPVRHIRKVHPDQEYEQCNCENELPEYGSHCYKATCHHTTRLIASMLELKEDSYSTSFQSRFSKNWLTPFTDDVLKDLLGRGKKRVLIVAPSFVADCLETIIEINDGYRKFFLHKGGEELTMVESLNDDDRWVEVISGMML
jgi:ferrochelatase